MARAKDPERPDRLALLRAPSAAVCYHVIMAAEPLALLAAASSTHGVLDVLTDLAAILCVAALTTVLFRRLRQPVVLGYLLAGLIVGPHLPIPIFADEPMAHQFSEIGVILLMFTLGLEFSLRKLVQVGPTAGIVAVIQCSLMIWLGYVVGRLFGWTVLESLFTGALIAISSTTIIVKAFNEQNVQGKLADFVFGILIVEDLIAIVLLAVLTPLASGHGLAAGALAWAVAKLVTFLVGMLALGMFLVPRLVRYVVRLGSHETTVVTSVGICFGCALVARQFGYSVALGAFLAGGLVAESGQGRAIEHALESVRDMFAAIFFVSVGMLIDPGLVARHWIAVLVLTLVVVVGKVFGVTLGSLLAGRSMRTSVQSGMSLAQIGEFSFIIAGVGLSLGAVGDFLYPVAVAVSALTTLVTPWLIRAASPVASFVDGRLPRPLQTFLSLYGSWLTQLRSARQQKSAWSHIRKLAGLLLIDLLAIATIVIAASVNNERVTAFAVEHIKLAPALVRSLFVAAVLVLTVPFMLGAVRIARALGTALTRAVFPAENGGLDRVAASRRALLVTFQLAILLVAGIPLAAVTQPFVRFPVVILVLAGVLILILPFWRSATNLHGHVRAGAQVILESLALQAHSPEGTSSSREQVQRLVPGLGEMATVRIEATDPVVGQTLKELNLRALTGAMVIAIERDQQSAIMYPGAEEILRPGDLLVMSGTQEAVTMAAALMHSPPRS
jgi:monovalent cation:H+ antiporter-2, CPA2 family